MGFLEEVEGLLRATARDRQTMFFSATIPDRIKGLSHHYMTNPVSIEIKADHITLDEINQIIVNTEEDTKIDKLCGFINEYQPYLAMVFCHTKKRVADVAMALAGRGYLADELHGDLSQSQRTLVLKRFRDAKLQILVATDIAARGLDIEGVTHVFNYDVPHDAEAYIHRIGRTGRAGEKGTAITFVNARQHEYLRMIEKGIQSRLQKQKLERREKTGKETPIRKTSEAAKKTAKPSTKYAASKPKTAEHGGVNHRSRRPKAAAGKANNPTSFKGKLGAKKKAVKRRIR